MSRTVTKSDEQSRKYCTLARNYCIKHIKGVDYPIVIFAYTGYGNTICGERVVKKIFFCNTLIIYFSKLCLSTSIDLCNGRLNLI